MTLKTISESVIGSWSVNPKAINALAIIIQTEKHICEYGRNNRCLKFLRKPNWWWISMETNMILLLNIRFLILNPQSLGEVRRAFHQHTLPSGQKMPPRS